MPKLAQLALYHQSQKLHFKLNPPFLIFHFCEVAAAIVEPRTTNKMKIEKCQTTNDKSVKTQNLKKMV
jgi:hypothetical protein